MSCEIYRQFALDHNWDQAARRRAAQTLQHLESCAECQRAVQDYDRLRQTLESFATQVDPPPSWAQVPRPTTLPPLPTRSASPTSISRYPSRWRIAWTAIAASILVASSVAFELGQAAARPVSFDRPSGFAASDRAFSPRELPGELENFEQLSNFYDGRVGWMLATNATPDFGLTNEAKVDARNILVLRLSLTNGPELTSNADLLIVPGQSADFTIPTRRGPALHYLVRTLANDPSRVSVSLQLASATSPDPLAVLATNLHLQPGEKLTAGRLVSAQDEYELKISFAYAGLPRGTP